MDISRLKKGPKEVAQPFSIVIDDTYTVLPHHTVPANVIVPGFGIEVSQHH